MTVWSGLSSSIMVLLVFVKGTMCLQCYICGENNAKEYGECDKQFAYDCSSYASRFEPTERLYCRTMRQKLENDSYTIMKECISEQDHYKTFPEKGYQLDDECDLIDIQGMEVAYCLCRHQNLCNSKSIGEQFVEFEKLHPELFDQDSAEEMATSSSGINQFSPNQMQENTRRKEPSRIDSMILPADKSMAIEGSFPNSYLLKPVSQDANIERADEPSSRDDYNQLINQQDDSIKDYSGSLKCIQCGQERVEGQEEDCAKYSVVDCGQGLKASQVLCFTREVNWSKGRSVIEKMCATNVSLIAEYGKDVLLNGCSIVNDGKVIICTCQSQECNKVSLNDQMILHQQRMHRIENKENFEKNSATEISKIEENSDDITYCYECKEDDLMDLTIDCSRTKETKCSRESYCYTQQISLGDGKYSLEKGCAPLQISSRYDSSQKPNVGCSTERDTLFCVCKDNFCNTGSISFQAKSFGAEKASQTTYYLSERSPAHSSEGFFDLKTKPYEKIVEMLENAQTTTEGLFTNLIYTAQNEELLSYLSETDDESSYFNRLRSFSESDCNCLRINPFLIISTIFVFIHL